MSKREIPAVAVVAVHGVADQKPTESARAVAELLLRQGDERYTSFSATDRILPLQPIDVGASHEPATHAFEERPPEIRAALRQARAGQQSKTAQEIDRLVLNSLLAEYSGSGQPYRTQRLTGSRLRQGEPEIEVHVYEMYWADLSRVGRGVLRLLGELYQLLLQLPNLGRQELDLAEIHHAGEPGWKWYARLHRWTVRGFTLMLPLLALLLLATILLSPHLALEAPAPASPDKPSDFLSPATLAGALLGLLVAALSSVALQLLKTRVSWVPLRLQIYLPPILGIVIGFLAAARRPPEWWQVTPERLLAALWCLILTVGILLLFRGYERFRPGARWFQWGALLLLVSAGFILLCPEVPQITIAVRSAEVAFAALLVAWVPLYLLALAAWGTGKWISYRHRKDRTVTARLQRLRWTVHGTLVLSFVLFLVGNVAIGAILFGLFKNQIPDAVGSYQGWLARLPWGLDAGLATKNNPRDYYFGLMELGATTGFPLVVLALVVLGALVGSGFAPSLWAELRPQRGKDSSTAQRRRSSAVSERLGKRVGVTLGIGRNGVTVLFFLYFVGMLPFTLLSWLVSRDYLPTSPLSTDQLLLGGTTLVSASVLGLFAGGFLRQLALGFRPILDIALDVESYQRQHPRGGTRRAQIVERFASLLRYLHRWRTPQGKQYRAVIFVAHSQGTVIAADMLRLLHHQPDTLFADGASEPVVPFYLFTMGSPLVQLYGECFPYQYRWVKAEDGEALAVNEEQAPLEDRPCRVEIGQGTTPDPSLLGVRRWVNAYHSGDYVGRHLWRTAGSPCLFSPWDEEGVQGPTTGPTASQDSAGLRRELCLGVGAHTHYWRGLFPEIGQELDRLITAAVADDPAPRGVRPATD